MFKKYLIIIFVISAGIIFGVFLFAPVSKTFYINNGNKIAAVAPQLLSIRIQNAADSPDSMSIPEIKPTQNLTENFAKTLAQGIISQNSEPQAGALLPGPGINMPNIDQTVNDYIQNSLRQANENLLNIAPARLAASPDNSPDAISVYLVTTQKIINDGLEPKNSNLIGVLQEIQNNNGAGSEKLYSIAASYEAVANEIEKNPVPSTLNNLMNEEIRLLRITANDLKAITNSETDPLGTMAAAKQFDSIIQSWVELQKKFDGFIKVMNGK